MADASGEVIRAWRAAAVELWREREALRQDLCRAGGEIARLAAEVERLKAGRFTEEEFQNLCHTFSADDPPRFKAGCREYWRKLFGDDHAE